MCNDSKCFPSIRIKRRLPLKQCLRRLARLFSHSPIAVTISSYRFEWDRLSDARLRWSTKRLEGKLHDVGVEVVVVASQSSPARPRTRARSWWDASAKRLSSCRHVCSENCPSTLRRWVQLLVEEVSLRHSRRLRLGQASTSPGYPASGFRQPGVPHLEAGARLCSLSNSF